MSELPLAPPSTPSPDTAQPVAAGLPPALARAARVVLQATALAALWALADQLVRICRLPVPAGIVGLAVLLVLLMTGRVRPAAVRDGANWLLTDMLLFFIPATVAAVQYGGLFRAEGWRLALVVVLGTMLVMGRGGAGGRAGGPLRAAPGAFACHASRLARAQADHPDPRPGLRTAP